MSRTFNSAKNLASSIGISLLMILLGFITRKMFVDAIGVDYLGLNGLLQNILGMMTLLEGGFATSVVYNMYKPLSQDNKIEILALLQLYKKVYRYIALGVLAFGICLYPILDSLIEDAADLQYLHIVYFIFLFNSLIQYFSAYKWSLINASQQNYKLTTINLIYQLSLSIFKIAILYYTANYILYLIVESLCGIALNIAVVRKANRLFPYVVNAPSYSVAPHIKQNIISNMKALFLHSLGGYFMHSTDNIVISAYIGVGVIGLYSNYTLLIGTVRNILSQILNSFSESIGNLIASESSYHSYKVFKTIFFINFLVVSSLVSVLSVIIQPFIQWWLGIEYLLPNWVIIIMLFNFFIDGMRVSAFMFKTKAGIFKQDRFTPLLQGILNLGLSLLLVRFLGLGGVLIATGLSILAIGFWQWPRLIYKFVFNVKLKEYFFRYGIYSCVLLLTVTSSILITQLINFDSVIFDLSIKSFITFIIILSVYYMSFRKTYEFKQLKEYCKLLICNYKR